MSQENVEIVRHWLAAMSAGPDRATVEEFWDADADYYPVRKFPEARPCHGQDAVLQFVTGYLDAYSRYEFAIRDVTAIGDDRVLARGNLRAVGRGSGMNLEGELYHCFWLRHGRFFREEDHLTASGALHALGLKGATLEAVGLSE
jgi:ketosteroid isomerase-like protein